MSAKYMYETVQINEGRRKTSSSACSKSLQLGPSMHTSLPCIVLSVLCLNGNDLHLRQLSGPNLISYLPPFHLSFLYPLITHIQTAWWRLKSSFTSSLLSAKLCPAPPIRMVINCVIFIRETIVPLDLQSRRLSKRGDI